LHAVLSRQHHILGLLAKEVKPKACEYKSIFNSNTVIDAIAFLVTVTKNS